MSKPPFLALDFGDRYIGLAYSDAGFLPQELATIDQRHLTEDEVLQRLAAVIKNQEIKTLVIGLPVNADGSENNRCRQSRRFSENFKDYLKLTLSFLPSTFYFPEDFSSFDAKQQLKQRSNLKKKFQPDHALAAKFILARFLEERYR